MIFEHLYMLMKARFDYEDLNAIFLKKPPLNFAKIHFFLVPDMASLKQKSSRRLRIFCPKNYSVTV